MKEEKFNPFEIESILDDKWQKEYYYKSMQTFTMMKESSDMMNRIKARKELSDNDLEYRDVIFTNQLKEEEKFPNYFYWARQHLSDSKGIDGYSKYSEVVKKCQRRKMEFWKKYSNAPPTTDEKAQTKKIISKVKWDYKGPSIATFFGLTIATMFILNLAKGSHQSKAILFCLGTFSGNVYADFRSKMILSVIVKIFSIIFLNFLMKKLNSKEKRQQIIASLLTFSKFVNQDIVQISKQFQYFKNRLMSKAFLE